MWPLIMAMLSLYMYIFLFSSAASCINNIGDLGSRRHFDVGRIFEGRCIHLQRLETLLSDEVGRFCYAEVSVFILQLLDVLSRTFRKPARLKHEQMNSLIEKVPFVISIRLDLIPLGAHSKRVRPLEPQAS